MSLATYASRDVDIGGVLYQGALVNEIEISSALSNLYYGFLAPTTFRVELSNIDGTFTQLFATDRRGTPIAVKRWDEIAGGTPTTQVIGRITSYEIGDTAIIDAAVELPSVLSTPIPRQTITVQTFPKATDLGVCIPVLFGNVKKLPLAYIFEDLATNVYIYLAGYAGTTPTYLYRDGVLVDPADYTVYNGTYNNSVSGVGGNLTAYCVVVFRLRQVDFGGRLYDRKEGDRLTADVTGLAPERNFARAIRSILSNATWGLGQSVDATTFDQAEADLTAIGGLYCDGWLLDQHPAKDYLDELASVRGMRFWQTASGAWAMAVDKAATSYAATFGYVDDLGYRNLVDPPALRTRNLSEDVTALDAEYRYDPISRAYLQVSSARTVSPFGQPKRVTLNFVRDHTTADKIVDYQSQKLKTLSRSISTRAGLEASVIGLADRVVLIAPPYGLYGGYEVRGLKQGLVTTGLELVPYSDDPYTYTAGTLPVDETPANGPDLSRTAPNAPSGLTVASTGTEQSSDGTTSAYVNLSWTASSTPGVTYLVQVRKVGESTFATWDETTGLTSRVRGLTPGLSYDLQVIARSPQQLFSSAAQRLNQLAPGDTTAPSAPTAVTVTQGTGKDLNVVVTCTLPPDFGDILLYRHTDNNPTYATHIATGSGTTFHDVAPSFETWYYYWAKVRDMTGLAAGQTSGANVSGFSPTGYGYAHQVADSEISGINVTKLIGYIVDSQIFSMAVSKLVGQIVTNQIANLAITTPKRQNQNSTSVSINVPTGSAAIYTLTHNLGVSPSTAYDIAIGSPIKAAGTQVILNTTQAKVLIWNESGITLTGTLTMYYW